MQVLSWFGLSRALGSDLPCPGFHFLCVSFLACLAKQRGVSIQRLRHVRVFRPHGLLPDRHRSLVERLCLGILALSAVKLPQVAKSGSRLRILRPPGFLPDRQCPPVERLGLGIFALSAVKLP